MMPRKMKNCSPCSQMKSLYPLGSLPSYPILSHSQPDPSLPSQKYPSPPSPPPPLRRHHHHLTLPSPLHPSHPLLPSPPLPFPNPCHTKCHAGNRPDVNAFSSILQRGRSLLTMVERRPYSLEVSCSVVHPNLRPEFALLLLLLQRLLPIIGAPFALEFFRSFMSSRLFSRGRKEESKRNCKRWPDLTSVFFLFFDI